MQRLIFWFKCFTDILYRMANNTTAKGPFQNYLNRWSSIILDNEGVFSASFASCSRVTLLRINNRWICFSPKLYRNNSLSENFVYVPNGWCAIKLKKDSLAVLKPSLTHFATASKILQMVYIIVEKIPNNL